MELKTSKKKNKSVSFQDFGLGLARLRAEKEAVLPSIQILRNNGKRRSETKKIILEALNKAGSNW
ncbi:hypothetical protein [Sphingorhabdus lutea]|uniref:hypothetical protein n=1 Tax=Sphingorhabdus lutea TaxID=1913578 RepID=UPI0012EC6587|nr:hypothetical protein [Sphingorhabdus lutea]